MSDWTAPGSSVDQPERADVAPPVRGTAAPTVGGDDRPRALPPPPVPLRPMTIPDVLDGAFAILERRSRDVLTVAAAFVLPVQVLSALLLRDVLDAGAFAGATDPTTMFSVDDAGAVTGAGAAVTTMAVGAVSLALLTGALTPMVLGWYRGVDVGPWKAIATSLRRSWALLVALVVVHLLEAVGLLVFGVGAYLAMALLHVVSPVIVAEGAGPLRAVRRSVQLTRRRFVAALAVPGLVAVLGMLVGFGFQAVPELATGLVPDGLDWLVRSVGQIVAELIVLPFTAGAAVLFYVDLRIRSEGFDLEIRTRERFGG